MCESDPNGVKTRSYRIPGTDRSVSCRDVVRLFILTNFPPGPGFDQVSVI